MPTFGTRTISGFFASTDTFSKYQPRPHTRVSPVVFVHVAPASFDRNSPPSLASITAYTMFGLLGAIAMPLRPNPSLGSPAVNCSHVVPPSTDLKMPPPGPFDGA